MASPTPSKPASVPPGRRKGGSENAARAASHVKGDADAFSSGDDADDDAAAAAFVGSAGAGAASAPGSRVLGLLGDEFLTCPLCDPRPAMLPAALLEHLLVNHHVTVAQIDQIVDLQVRCLYTAPSICRQLTGLRLAGQAYLDHYLAGVRDEAGLAAKLVRISTTAVQPGGMRAHAWRL